MAHSLVLGHKPALLQTHIESCEFGASALRPELEDSRVRCPSADELSMLFKVHASNQQCCLPKASHEGSIKIEHFQESSCSWLMQADNA